MVGAGSALLLALGCIRLAAHFSSTLITTHATIEFRLNLFACSLILPVIMLIICIVRLAQHRFFTLEDIDGSGLSEGSPRAKVLQALLQNTLEQLAVAMPVYLLAALTLRSDLLAIVPSTAALFVVGRIFFFMGYAGGAPSRAFGFALTFYSTVILSLISIYFLALS